MPASDCYSEKDEDKFENMTDYEEMSEFSDE